jgi:hypothetical protein
MRTREPAAHSAGRGFCYEENEMDESFREASVAVESAAMAVILAKHGIPLMKRGIVSPQKVYAVLVDAVTKIEESRDSIETAAEELARVSDSIILYGGLGYPSAHEAMLSAHHLAFPKDQIKPIEQIPESTCRWLLDSIGTDLEAIPAEEWQARICRERAKLLERNEGSDPVDWKKLADNTKRAPKQYELVRILVDTNDWIPFNELADLVWQDEDKTSPAITQQIKRANETLEKIGARVHIRQDKERAIADIF